MDKVIKSMKKDKVMSKNTSDVFDRIKDLSAAEVLEDLHPEYELKKSNTFAQ
jgi:hypothetical protein